MAELKHYLKYKKNKNLNIFDIIGLKNQQAVPARLKVQEKCHPP